MTPPAYRMGESGKEALDALDRLDRSMRASAASMGMATSTRWDEDIATVRRSLSALRDEAEQLREERAAQDARWQEFSRPFDKAEYDAMYERMVAAEAEAQRLREERDAAQDALQSLAADHYFARAEAAEAELRLARAKLERAEEGLRPFASMGEHLTTAHRNRGYISARVPTEWIDKARALLAASSPSPGDTEGSCRCAACNPDAAPGAAAYAGHPPSGANPEGGKA